MTDDKLQRWALLAEIIGGIAIVISLGVVAYELNQGTKQTAISSYQDLIGNIVDLNESAISNPVLMRALARSFEDSESLTEDEMRVVRFYYMSLFRHGDIAYFHYESGAIDQDRLDSALRVLTTRLRTDFALNFWNRQKTLFVQSYQDYIDEAIKREKGTGIDF